jgi:hypothetical protein
VSRLRKVFLIVLGTLPLADLAAAAAPCTAKFGDVVDFGKCNPVNLPGVNVKFLGVSQPNKGVPLSCWNYEASAGTDAVTFRHCHTGLLGGFSVVSVGERSFSVFFDVSSGCARTPNGPWVPTARGHTFHTGALDSAAREDILRKHSEAERQCFARNGPTPETAPTPVP